MSQVNGRTILVVDDEPDLVEVTAAMLELEGARVLTAHGGDEALAILGREAVDAVVSDVRMPGGTGFDLLRGLNPLTSAPPVILVTGFTELSADEARALGAHALLGKPCDYPTLIAELARALGR